ncbi:MAG: hypothetical protein ACI3WR_04470 [Oscillospiraceae bacterium]
MKTILRGTLAANRRWLPWLLAAAALALLLVLLGGSAALLAFPYAQAGALLRRLSLASSAGNLAAWLLFFLLGAVPAGVWLWLKRKDLRWEGDWALPFFSPALWLLLYAMVNPGLLADFLSLDNGAAMTEVAQTALALVFDSFLVLYLVLRLLHRAADGGPEALPRGLCFALSAVAAACVLLFCAVCVPTLVSAFRTEESDLLWGASQYAGFPFAAFARFLIDGGALLADAWAALMGVYLLRELQRDRYGEQSIAAAHALAAFCRTALTVLLLATALYNLVSLFTLSGGADIQLSVPVFSIAFSLLLLLLARAMEDRRVLKQENDLFI